MSEPELIVDIPNEAGWPVRSVDSLCSLISRGTAPVYVEHSEVLAIGQRCITTTDFAPNLARPHSHRAMRKVLQPEPGDVLLNSTGAGTIGRSAIFNSPGTFIVDGHVTVMRPRGELADSRWLNSVLRTPAIQRHLERFCFAGSTNQLELSRTPLRISKLPTPNIDDQRAMGRVIDTLDTAIHETEAIITKLKAVKQGLLHDLLTRGIDANGELRPTQAEAPHLYKDSPLGWIPKEWTTLTFDELESRPTLGLPIRGASADFRNVGLLKMVNLSANNEVDLKSVEPIARDRVADIGKFKLEDGDLLFNTRNTPELVGKTCSWRAVPGSEYVFDNNILRARIPRKLGTGHYFADYLGNEIGRRRLLRLATGTTSVAAIYWKDLSEFKMPAPPVCEQFAIHERIDTIDSNRKTAEEAVNALLGVKAGLMDDLLTGRVRVTALLAETAQQPGSA